MKAIALNFYEALKWLIGYRPKAMPLTNKWIELDKQEQYRIAQAKMWEENHAKKVRPFWHRKLNTIEKNTLKLKDRTDLFDLNILVSDFFLNKEVISAENIVKCYEQKFDKIDSNLTPAEKLNAIIAKNPEFFNRKHIMSDADYIKCDGNQKKYHRDYINFYAPSDTHFSNEFILSADDSDLDLFDIEGEEDFKNWFIETRNNLINKM